MVNIDLIDARRPRVAREDGRGRSQTGQRTGDVTKDEGGRRTNLRKTKKGTKPENGLWK